MTHLITTEERADAANTLIKHEEYKENGALKLLKRLPKSVAYSLPSYSALTRTQTLQVQ